MGGHGAHASFGLWKHVSFLLCGSFDTPGGAAQQAQFFLHVWIHAGPWLTMHSDNGFSKHADVYCHMYTLGCLCQGTVTNRWSPPAYFCYLTLTLTRAERADVSVALCRSAAIRSKFSPLARASSAPSAGPAGRFLPPLTQRASLAT